MQGPRKQRQRQKIARVRHRAALHSTELRSLTRFGTGSAALSAVCPGVFKLQDPRVGPFVVLAELRLKQNAFAEGLARKGFEQAWGEGRTFLAVAATPLQPCRLQFGRRAKQFIACKPIYRSATTCSHCLSNLWLSQRLFQE